MTAHFARKVVRCCVAKCLAQPRLHCDCFCFVSDWPSTDYSQYRDPAWSHTPHQEHHHDTLSVAYPGLRLSKYRHLFEARRCASASREIDDHIPSATREGIAGIDCARLRTHLGQTNNPVVPSSSLCKLSWTARTFALSVALSEVI
jgi:hypothetical protein